MIESLQVSAQLTTIVEVDVTEVGRLRRQYNATVGDSGTRLSYLPFIASAAVEALRRFPAVNSTVDLTAGTVTYPDAEHLGLAVDTERGLFVPVVRDAGTLPVTQLAERIADVAQRTRAGTVGVDELSGGTFTITNTGSRGALMDTPIINQPQVAILGAGVVARRPVVMGREGDDESIAIRSMVYLSLTYDHRIVDGSDAARYLSAVKERLESGSFDLGSV
jgi:pyruvate/2-oxoglutarate dehydrogenase complex dihydrolipoamide acyltransferase (E2) component